MSVLLTLYYCVSINSGYSTLASCIKESSNRDQGRCGAPIWWIIFLYAYTENIYIYIKHITSFTDNRYITRNSISYFSPNHRFTWKIEKILHEKIICLSLEHYNGTDTYTKRCDWLWWYFTILDETGLIKAVMYILPMVRIWFVIWYKDRGILTSSRFLSLNTRN